MAPEYSMLILYSERAPYRDLLNALREASKMIRARWGMEIEEVESSRIGPDEAERIKSDMRSIPPHIRGRITSSGGRPLPLSGRKNLNLGNTPILLLYRGREPIDVYPHLLGASYFGVLEAIYRILELGPRFYAESRGILEDPISRIVRDRPEIIEEGLKFKGSNVDVGTGTADLIMEDRDGNPLVMEIETIAGEGAVAQVSRLALGYAQRFGVSKDTVRMGIICAGFDAKALRACESLGIELYQIIAKRIV
ncbi:MAG: hypothetical protein QXW19_03285 [Candidatus Bathyarchaeia archaeon]